MIIGKEVSLWWRHNWFNAILLLLFGVCSYLMLRSSSDVNHILFDSSVGINVSLLIYLLVVWVPERKKRIRLRRNLRLQYDSFKEECIIIFFSALGAGITQDEIDRLKDRDEFARFFKERHVLDQSRWDGVANGLTAEHVKLIAMEFEILRDELHLTFNAIDIDHPEAFRLLKDLSAVLYRTKHVSPGYDDEKSLLRFLWTVFSGWSLSGGYTKTDAIAQAIDSI